MGRHLRVGAAVGLLGSSTLLGCAGAGRPAVRPAPRPAPVRIEPGDDALVRPPTVEGMAPSVRAGKSARGAEPSLD